VVDESATGEGFEQVFWDCFIMILIPTEQWGNHFTFVLALTSTVINTVP